MLFNVAKCGVVHIGYNNPKENYTLGGIQINTLHEERDLGVIIDDNLKSRKQCAKAVSAANATLGMIKRSFINREKKTILALYKSVVRPKLEYCIQAWRPYLKKDIELMERVQHRATKLISSLRKETYENRLKLLGLTTLETRRLRGDLIEAFKIMKGYEDISWQTFFTMSSTAQLRGHHQKFYKHSVRLDIRKYSFSQRVINEWNLLPDEIFECTTVNNFKNQLDLHLRNNRGFK
jgi:ribonucleases P/MRP protein subunit RPP40